MNNKVYKTLMIVYSAVLLCVILFCLFQLYKLSGEAADERIIVNEYFYKVAKYELGLFISSILSSISLLVLSIRLGKQ